MKPNTLFTLVATFIAAMLAALTLQSCTTAQLNSAQSIVDPIAVALVSGYAQQYGVPPALTAAVVTPLVNDAWGMFAQAQAKQPIAQGAAIATVGTAVAAKSPTPAQLVNAIGNLKLAQSNPNIAAAILTAAQVK